MFKTIDKSTKEAEESGSLSTTQEVEAAPPHTHLPAGTRQRGRRGGFLHTDLLAHRSVSHRWSVIHQQNPGKTSLLLLDPIAPQTPRCWLRQHHLSHRKSESGTDSSCPTFRRSLRPASKSLPNSPPATPRLSPSSRHPGCYLRCSVQVI